MRGLCGEEKKLINLWKRQHVREILFIELLLIQVHKMLGENHWDLLISINFAIL